MQGFIYCLGIVAGFFVCKEDDESAKGDRLVEKG